MKERDFIENKQKIKVVSIVGPTATGKTELSIRLAEKFNIEIISADSMQVYKEFNILSAKSSANYTKKVRHYMIDILSVTEEFSVAKFVELAHKYINIISSKNKIPVLVGGTGLYLDSLLKNIKFESSNKNIKLNKNLNELENSKLMEMLYKIDPKTAEKLHINDRKRILRALEFYYTTGSLISEQVEKSKKSELVYDVCKIGLNFVNRNLMYDKINNRVDYMFDNGIINEVKEIINFKLSKTAESAIGYKETKDLINNNLNLEEVKNKIKQNTRRYAKRQLTWFRRDESINWIYLDNCENFDSIVQKSEKIISNFMGLDSV